MERWRSFFPVDPVPLLVGSRDGELSIRARNELLNERLEVREIWTSRAAQSLLSNQHPDGNWRYKSPREEVRSLEDYNLLETYRVLGFLVEMYALDIGHEGIRRASEFVLSRQTDEGDIRGIYGNQYTPNYTAGFLELLIKAGLGEDGRVRKGMEWLLSIRQNDGGWAIPLRTRGRRLDVASMKEPPLSPDPTKPFSHMATGVVLRAFAAHPRYRERAEVRLAASLLKSRLLKRDSYPDRGAPDYWQRCSFPFWMTDIVSALDSLTIIGYGLDEPEVLRGMEWLRQRQLPDGRFRLHLLHGAHMEVPDWMVFAISRVTKRLF